MTAVKCEKLSKSFDGKRVLNNISFELEEHGIYALIGRNGAGKTTLMKCICTKYLPDGGDVFLLGERAYENEKVLGDICFMSDVMDAFSLENVKAVMKYAGNFYPKWNAKLKEELIKKFEIKEKDSYESLSKGQKTIVSLIIGLCSGCRIVLFDEIYSGMDAVARQDFYELLLEQQEIFPRTFVLSTHLIEEMAGLFTDLLVLDKGELILHEDMESFHEKAFRAVGRAGEAFPLPGKKVLSTREMGSMAEYCFYDSFDRAEREVLKEKGIALEAMSLQELFVAMVRQEG